MPLIPLNAYEDKKIDTFVNHADIEQSVRYRTDKYLCSM